MRRPVSISPSAVTGYELNPVRGYFSVVVPEATQNLFLNPSFETNTTGTTALSLGAIARTPDHQAFGAHALSYTPDATVSDGVYFSFATLATDTTHTFSAYVKGAPGVSYRLYFYDNTNSIVLAETQFRGDGRWRRYWVTGATTNGTSHWCVIRKNNSTSTAAFYIDGCQLEEKDHVTTYADGDMVGFLPNQNAFYWLGTRHASRSVRIGATAAGGRVERLDKAGLQVSAYTGASMPPVSNIAIPNALVGGASYQRTVVQSRAFTITGDVEAYTPQQLQRKKRDLENLFRPPVEDQPILIRYQLFDDCGNERGDEIEIKCVYTAGLEGNTDNLYSERVQPQFVANDPYWRSVLDTAKTVDDVIINVPDGDYIARRRAPMELNKIDPLSGLLVDSLWTRVSEGLDLAVRTMAWGPDGKLYVGGDFVNADNGSPIAVNYIAVYDPDLGEWNDLDTGLNGIVRSIAFDALGNLYVGGEFTTAGAGATVVDRIAMWDGAAWNALGGTPGVGGGVVYGVGVASDNSVYVGGTFTTAGGAAAERLAKWDGSAWSPVFVSPNGPNAIVRCLQVDINNNDDVYFGGDFTTVDGSSISRVAKFSQTTGDAEALGAGLSDSCYTMLLRPDGSLVVGGTFVSAGGNNVGPTGVDDGKIAIWNGSAWGPVGGGLGTGDVDAIGFDPVTGNTYFGGDFTTYFQNFRAGGQTTIEGFVGWNGSGFFQPDVNLPGTSEVFSIIGRITGELVIGSSTTGNLVMTLLIVATANGNANAYPRIVMTGEGPLYQLLNLTTNQAIYFNNLTIADGETLTLDLVNKSFFSNLRGNLLSKITSGSDLATWRLAPGENLIGMYVPNATAEVSLIWKETYLGPEGAVL